MITSVELQEIYFDRFTRGKRTGEYIRYLNRVDPQLWTPTMLENEFGLNQAVVSNVLRKRKATLKVDRRKGLERRKK